MREIAVTDKIRLLVHLPESGESVPDFAGVALAVKHTGGIGGSWEGNNVSTAAATAGWGMDDALRAVRMAHLDEVSKKSADLAQNEISADFGICCTALFAVGLLHLSHFWMALFIFAFFYLFPLALFSSVVKKAWKWNCLMACIWASVLLSLGMDFGKMGEEASWPEAIGLFLLPLVASIVGCISEPEDRLDAEAHRLLDAIGQAKMGSPRSIIEVWVADGQGGWARV